MPTLTLDRRIVQIGRCEYAVRELEIDPAIGTRAVRFARLDDSRAVHDCRQEADGHLVCECGDWTFRRMHTGKLCKHLRTAVELGMLDAPTPALPRVRDEFDEPTPAPATDRVPERLLDAGDQAGRFVIVRLPGATTHPFAVCDEAGQILDVFRTEDAAHDHAEAQQLDRAGESFAAELCDAVFPDAGPADSWDAWTDTPALELLDAEDDRLDLPAALEAIRSRFLALDNSLGDLVAEAIGEIIGEVRITGARTVDQLRDRRAVLYR